MAGWTKGEKYCSLCIHGYYCDWWCQDNCKECAAYLSYCDPEKTKCGYQIYKEIRKLKFENQQLREVLQSLYDEQNGPPLLTREKQWNDVMARAEFLLIEPENGGI